MKRVLNYLILAVLFGVSSQAQTPVNVRAGNLACAAIRRPSAQVQTYCYLWPANPTWVLVHNQIDTIPAFGLIVSFGMCVHVDATDPTKCDDIVPNVPTYGGVSWYQFETDSVIVWRFTLLADGSMKYEYSFDGVSLVTGTLP